ncbi:dispanin subfamily A member 2b-like [Brachionichthys hirsutus]|uniref:dispanin subfamily A member 2b-like n=1 Tax=Brachionichthys hirsutus TaxID=412623 RepID=UPI00360432CE
MNPMAMGHPSGQPGPPTVVQYTTVSVSSEPPKDHILWSLCCFVYYNPCCLGLAALIYSIKARDRKWIGDVEGARHYGSTARCLNISATVVGCIGALIVIIVVAVVTSTATSGYSYVNRYQYNG